MAREVLIAHFNKYDAYEYSQINQSITRFLHIYRIKLGILYNLSSQASNLVVYFIINEEPFQENLLMKSRNQNSFENLI